jgi:hypothetical protein
MGMMPAGAPEALARLQARRRSAGALIRTAPALPMPMRTFLISVRRWGRLPSVALALLVTLVAFGPLHLLGPTRAKAHMVLSPVGVGTSFSPSRATYYGLDYQAAFKQLETMHFRVIRLSAYWNEVDAYGYDQLDWLTAEAERSGQPIVISVGMKGLGWPEFYIPPSVFTGSPPSDGHDVSQDPALRIAAMAFVENTVVRYRHNRALYAWQIENEPFNRAGPSHWWISPAFVSDEIDAARSFDDRHRPVIVNAFGHFNLFFDQASNRDGIDLRSLLGFEGDSAEKESLAVLGQGDILGLDVYTGIGYQFMGGSHLSHAGSDWPEQITRWREQAHAQGKDAWITEAQAEPWEASVKTLVDPKSVSPETIVSMFGALKDAGYSTVLLWGSEYWLWRAADGDSRWLDAVQSILHAEAKAPSLTLPA